MTSVPPRVSPDVKTPPARTADQRLHRPRRPTIKKSLFQFVGRLKTPHPSQGPDLRWTLLAGTGADSDAVGTRSPLPDSPSLQLCPDLVSVHGNVSFSPLAPPCTPTRLPAIYGANLQPRHYSSCTRRVGGRFRRSTPSIKPPAGPNQLG